ncbi:histone-like nucleoid-structuring protein Lsr2 [Actinomadura sp. WMMA1423]|uniref:Lsr2 family DNA-binding protein n=1 Tax=Actinomadura sp. WMMA1423 TaxID=2591108 RepID=UPI00143D868D|nr:histone-like nucleoid-structuring protein Lsr2 [Actinomadura sp. WMMA1423]
MPAQTIELTDRQRRALAGGKTVQWAADAFGLPRPQLVAAIAAAGLVIDPATDLVRARRAAPTRPTREAAMSSDTPTVLDTLRSGTPIPQVAADHGWSEMSVRALVNGKKGWSIDPADDSVHIDDDTPAQVDDSDTPEDTPTTSPPPRSGSPTSERDSAPAAPTPTPAETIAGGVEQLLAAARASGDKRLERAALKAQTAIGVVVGLYEPWLAEQKAAGKRAQELATAEKAAAKLRAELEEAQAKVAALKGTPARTTSGRARSHAIRTWAAREGIKVNERGRIPAHIVERYERDHGGGDVP